LIGLTFLKDTKEDGQHFRAHVVRAVVEMEEDLKKGAEYMKFIPDSNVDEMFTYNEIVNHNEKDNADIENDTEWLYNCRRIAAHQGPLLKSDKDYKGSTYNVFVEWETGESTSEPLDLIASDDPVICAEYALKHNLLGEPGWKSFRHYTKNEKKLGGFVNQTKVRSYR
jgi:predicted RND superfamily exporter protein